jgi:hypothetical protein
VLDVSEGGLCILSPVAFKPKQPLVIEIEIPPQGPVEVEAVVWHVRAAKSGRSGRKVWSIGMMISKAAAGFDALLPGHSRHWDDGASEARVGKPEERSPDRRAPAAPDLALEEDSLSAAELDDLDLELLSPAELKDLTPPSPAGRGGSPRAKTSSPDTLRLFRIRVKAQTGPRTRTLTLGAVSVAEARALASADLGESWVILEVKAA